MTRARVPRIFSDATASGPGRSSWLASAPPVGLALLVVLNAWISGMTLLGDALLLLIKVAAALLAVAWAAAALPGRFGRGSRPHAVVTGLAILGLGAAGMVWMFPGVWIIPSVPLALPTLGIAHTIPAAYILAPALVCVGGYVAYQRFIGFRRGSVAQRRDRIAADSPRDVVRVGKSRPAMLEHRRRIATLPETPTEPVELRIALAIAPGEDADAAAALATKAITEMTSGQGIPAAVYARGATPPRAEWCWTSAFTSATSDAGGRTCSPTRRHSCGTYCTHTASPLHSSHPRCRAGARQQTTLDQSAAACRARLKAFCRFWRSRNRYAQRGDARDQRHGEADGLALDDAI
jgi:hypothetical protein